MLEKGHQRDAQQCQVKIKELRQSYQKTREANSHSGSSSKTFRFYEELHAILGGDCTTVPPHSIDTSTSSQSMINEGDSVDEEEEEEAVESRVQESVLSILPESQNIFLTPEQSSITQDSTNDPLEGISDTWAVDPPLKSAVDRLSQIRKRKEKSRDDMFAELMNTSAAAETEQRAWWLSLSQNMGQMQDPDHSTTQEMLRLLRDQADMLRRLVNLYEERRQDSVPLQPLHNASQPRAMPPSPSSTPKMSRRRLARMQYMLSSTPVEVSRKL
ncbi:uncharacterized protein [Emydura macquarii macquarii]|uniref:uncharacterized protein n=1 Tax=Emydura macquarii macquarii TaxID=1129001 RepID=UPI00352B6820